MDWFKVLPLNVFLLAVGVYIISLILKKVLGVGKNKTLKRLFPLVPLILCIALAFVPGIFPDMEAGPKLLNGLFACFASVYLHDFLKKTALGKVNLLPLFEAEKRTPRKEEPDPPSTD